MIKIPIGGNTWSYPKGVGGGLVRNKGIVRWTNPGLYFITYVYLSQPAELMIAIEGDFSLSSCTLSISIDGKSKELPIQAGEQKVYPIGKWVLGSPGYVSIILKGISKSDSQFPIITTINLEGVPQELIYFVPESHDFAFGRRGTSAYLNYQIPEKVNIESFYGELLIPKSNDIIGSYFMATGFTNGYFGIQVNSKTERRVLFSVWNPCKSDNPEDVPVHLRVQLIQKGEGVIVGPFGNEGSGLQCIFRHMWNAERVYGFLVVCHPQPNNYTDYTGYFYDAESNKWRLMATFRFPSQSDFLKNPGSFLENFYPDEGDVQRQGVYKNQWIRTETGEWIELTKAKIGASGEQHYRKDFGGGSVADTFYLRGFGFFDDGKPEGFNLERLQTGTMKHTAHFQKTWSKYVQ